MAMVSTEPATAAWFPKANEHDSASCMGRGWTLAGSPSTKTPSSWQKNKNRTVTYSKGNHGQLFQGTRTKKMKGALSAFWSAVEAPLLLGFLVFSHQKHRLKPKSTSGLCGPLKRLTSLCREALEWIYDFRNKLGGPAPRLRPEGTRPHRGLIRIGTGVARGALLLV